LPLWVNCFINCHWLYVWLTYKPSQIELWFLSRGTNKSINKNTEENFKLFNATFIKIKLINSLVWVLQTNKITESLIQFVNFYKHKIAEPLWYTIIQIICTSKNLLNYDKHT